MSPQALLTALFLSSFAYYYVNGRGVKPTFTGKGQGYMYKIACGIPPVEIDKRYYGCSDGIAVPRTVTSTANPDKSSANISTTHLPTHAYNDRCSTTDLLICDGTPRCGAEQGYECCGFGTYHPGFQTCCRISSAKYKIHNDTQEKENVCCDLEVYKRGSKWLPCEHPSSNDKFSRKLMTIKRGLPLELTQCEMGTLRPQYVYKIDITRRSGSNSTSPVMHATISLWLLRSSSRIDLRKTSYQKGYMDIRFDKYSPLKRNLVGRSYFTITSKDYLDNAVFFLNPSDNLYLWPKKVKKQRKVLNFLRKIQRLCNGQKQRSTKRSSRKSKKNM